MPFTDPPPLPRFLRGTLPVGRRAYLLETGPDAGRRIHFLDCGRRDAQPVLLVHGNPTWSYLWRRVIGALDLDRFRCLAPDLLGFGLSSKLPRARDHRLDRHLASLGEWIGALALERDLIVVGQDWGGPLSVGTALRAPVGVAGVVLGNTSVLLPARARGTWFHRFSHLPVVSDLAFRGVGFPQIALGTAQGDRRSISGRVARAYRWPLRRPWRRAGPLGLARMVPVGDDHPSLGPLREIDAWVRAYRGPAALVWGERDPILGRALQKHVEALPQASVTRTAAGHFLQEEVPERLAAAIEGVARQAPVNAVVASDPAAAER